MAIDFNSHHSLCELRQKIIISRDKRGRCEHRAENRDLCRVRQYRVDGDLINTGKRCDFALLNVDAETAYMIELKGADIHYAIKQVEESGQAFKAELPEYRLFYRIIYRSRTQAVHDEKTRRWLERCGRDTYKGNFRQIAIISQLTYTECI